MWTFMMVQEVYIKKHKHAAPADISVPPEGFTPTSLYKEATVHVEWR